MPQLAIRARWFATISRALASRIAAAIKRGSRRGIAGLRHAEERFKPRRRWVRARPAPGPPICRVPREAPDRQLQSRRSPQTLRRRRRLYRKRRPPIFRRQRFVIWRRPKSGPHNKKAPTSVRQRRGQNGRHDRGACKQHGRASTDKLAQKSPSKETPGPIEHSAGVRAPARGNPFRASWRTSGRTLSRSAFGPSGHEPAGKTARIGREAICNSSRRKPDCRRAPRWIPLELACPPRASGNCTPS